MASAVMFAVSGTCFTKTIELTGNATTPHSLDYSAGLDGPDYGAFSAGGSRGRDSGAPATRIGVLDGRGTSRVIHAVFSPRYNAAAMWLGAVSPQRMAGGTATARLRRRGAAQVGVLAHPCPSHSHSHDGKESMTMTTAPTRSAGEVPLLPTLPSDEIRQVMWRWRDRDDLWQLVRATRGVARGLVARLVAQGQRDTYQWTPEKHRLLDALDAAGVSSVLVDPQYGGTGRGSKNLALALAVYELAWVDGGAASCLMALRLALEPIMMLGTDEQKDRYLRASIPQGGAPAARGAFCLTEPLPYAGVDTGMLSGKVSVEQWPDGEIPILPRAEAGPVHQ